MHVFNYFLYDLKNCYIWKILLIDAPELSWLSLLNQNFAIKYDRINKTYRETEGSGWQGQSYDRCKWKRWENFYSLLKVFWISLRTSNRTQKRLTMATGYGSIDVWCNLYIFKSVSQSARRRHKILSKTFECK